MEKIIILIVLITGVIAIAQLVRVYELTYKLKNKGEHEIPDRDNNLNAKLMLGFMMFQFLGFIYLMLKYGWTGRGEAASLQGVETDWLLNVNFIIIIAVFFLTNFLLFFFSYKYVRKPGVKATYYSHNNKLELIWTIVPAIVLSGIVLYGLSVWNDVMDVSDAENPLIVEVYAKQFQWEARYAGEDNELGLANVRNIEGINTMGVDMTDKNALDDVPVRELHLPKGRKVIFKFRSQDVLHSAYMPHFRAQMNCVPGMVTQFAFTPSMTTEEMRLNDKTIAKVDGINKIRAEKGEDPYILDYLLLCNKICGSSHYNMQMKIIVEEEAQFNAWLKDQKTMAQVVVQ